MPDSFTSEAPTRGKIYENMVDTIGATPLVKLSGLMQAHGVKANILGKCEFFNPLASVKDRIGFAMIEAAEKKGMIKEGTVLVEPTSGNTGIALAFVCASRGYRLILTMPESMSKERRKMLALLGAELELTPAAKGMSGAIARAEQLVKELPDAFMPQQFKNEANPAIHTRTTAHEIWTDTGGKIDVFVSGVGTGGTITGTGAALKDQDENIKLVAVEPEDSPILSGGVPGPHKIQGIGAGFIPDILNTGLIDEVLKIGNETAFATSRQVAKTDGAPVGISSGAALAAAIEIGQRDGMEGKNIVVVLPSFAERYLSTALFDGVVAE